MLLSPGDAWKLLLFGSICEESLLSQGHVLQGPADNQELQRPDRRYADSIESLVRNNIQKMKIDMANEVIDAGRFDMNTSMEERKQSLESLLQVGD